MPRLVLLAPGLLAAALATHPPRAAGAEPVTLVVCAPGYPGTPAEAQPRMDALARAVAAAARLAPGSVAAVYEPTEKGGVARIAAPGASLALVPLPFLVAHGEALKLTPRLAVASAEGGATEVWSLVARRGRVRGPGDLAGFTISSTAGYAPGFVRGALARFGAIPESAKIVSSSQVLSALRKAAAGGDVAVLLDGGQSAALATLPFAGELEVVARSEPLPAAFLTAVRGRLSPARLRAIERAAADLRATPEGAAALDALQIARFSPLEPDALAAVGRVRAGGRP